MGTVLLAIDDQALRLACRAQLDAGGHATLVIDRPLEPLSLARKLQWDAVVVDDSSLGRETLQTLIAGREPSPRVGLGFVSEALDVSLTLPLIADKLLTAVTGRVQTGPPPLLLDPQRRTATANGREVQLTRIEYRLLQLLFERRPHDVSLIEMLESVWGFTEGRGAGEMVRAHVRNLRIKLAEIGMSEALQSHRGRGYAFVA